MTTVPGQTSAAPLFSVLMAARNHSAYVEETLESIGRQSDRDFELIVVDDGSTDDTANKVAEWMAGFRASHPHRLQLHRTANGGQSAALAFGFEDCRGRYICLLDSDDRWLPGKLSRVREAAAAAPDAGMIVHPLYVIDAAGKRTGDVRPLRAKLSDGDCREIMRSTGRHVAPATSAVVIRADIFRQLLPVPTSGFPFGADAYLTFGATLLAPVRAVDTPLGEYRMHSQGQYLRRMTSEDGLARTCDFQRTIADHFGLEMALRRNSFFARNAFALWKLTGGLAPQLESYRALIRATVHDESFTPVARAALAAFWSACLVAPRPIFRRLWTRFQIIQTGYTGR